MLRGLDPYQYNQGFYIKKKYRLNRLQSLVYIEKKPEKNHEASIPPSVYANNVVDIWMLNNKSLINHL